MSGRWLCFIFETYWKLSSSLLIHCVKQRTFTPIEVMLAIVCFPILLSKAYLSTIAAGLENDRHHNLICMQISMYASGQHRLEGFSKHRLLIPSSSFWFSSSGWGLGICISGKIPGDAEAADAVLGPYFPFPLV